MYQVKNKKKKKKTWKKINTYHAQESFSVKEDFNSS